jgi:hypothetical protein
MLQVVQNVRSGKLELIEVPAPVLLPGGVIVRTAASIISPGTEKMIMDLAKKSHRKKREAGLVRQVISARTRVCLIHFKTSWQRWTSRFRLIQRRGSNRSR